MNVTELARKLKVNTKELLEILPRYGFDIGTKAIKIDNRVAQKIMRQWRHIKRDLEEKKRKEFEEQKEKEKEMRIKEGKWVKLPSVLTVRQFADKLEMPVTQVITELMKNGILANQNQNIDYDTAAIMAEELGFSAKKEEEQTDQEQEEEKIQALEQALAKSEQLRPRPPVVVVMGHVDHGKTKLLDAIRQTNIIDTEAGGITQHIGAYQTVWEGPKSHKQRTLTFIDTPGHEAFTVMRSRGAQVADIAILVVAADDGVKPQTEEVIQIIKAAGLPFVVAINKIDTEGADPQKVRTELSRRDLLAEDWGGDVPMVEISAKQKINIDKLLDVLLLVAEINQEKIKADPSLPAVGTVIESHVDKGMGPVATVLLRSGTLHGRDPLIVNGENYGSVRAMKDYIGQEVDSAGPSDPIQIIGFKVAPEVGDILDVGKAGQAKKIDIKQKKVKQTGAERHTVVKIEDQEEDEGKKTLNLLIKADVLGSLEAIIDSLEKIEHDEVAIKIVGKGLGNITEDDVNKAQAGEAKIIGFNVIATPIARESMREERIDFLRFDIIYDLIDWCKKELEKLLSAEKIITELGRLKVKAIFRTDKKAMTVGGTVTEGKIRKGALARIKRKGQIVGRGRISSCQIGKQDMNEVPAGSECGIRFEGKNKIENGDIIEAYIEETKTRQIVFK